MLSTGQYQRYHLVQKRITSKLLRNCRGLLQEGQDHSSDGTESLHSLPTPVLCSSDIEHVHAQ